MTTRIKMYTAFTLAALALLSALTAGASAAVRGVGQSAGFAGAENGYVLREHDGHVAVYYAGFDKIPAVVTEIEVGQLPEADRIMLSEGLGVETREELLLLLEDLGS